MLKSAAGRGKHEPMSGQVSKGAVHAIEFVPQSASGIHYIELGGFDGRPPGFGRLRTIER